MRNSLGYEIRCNNKIELGQHVVVYCVLQAGHDGHCQPDDQMTAATTRCQSLHPCTKQQCGLPNGHKTRHGNGNMVQPW